MPKGKTSPGGKKITKGAKITKKTKEISVAKTKQENLPELSKPLTRSKRSLATGDKQTPVKAKKQRLTGEKRPIDGCFKRVLNKELLAEAKAAKKQCTVENQQDSNNNATLHLPVDTQRLVVGTAKSLIESIKRWKTQAAIEK